MYQLPNIQDAEKARDSVTDGFSRQKNILEYHVLEARQMRILKQVKQLRQCMEYLSVAIRLSNDIKVPPPNFPFMDIVKSESSKNPIRAEIIVNANPASPPYSILALQRIWKDTKFNVDIHRHSTAIDTITNKFEEKLITKTISGTVHDVRLKLIWKDIPNIQFITKVYGYPLEGEANFLRYLTRLITNYNYETSKSLADTVTIDTVLDLCLRLSCEESKSVTAVLAKFAGYLNETPWLINFSDPSIVDVAAWSIIKQRAHNRIPRELKKWYDLCEKTFISS